MTGYYIYASRCKRHAPSDRQVGTNFYRVPAHPPQYYFAKYTLDLLLFSASAVRFNTTDSIVITDADGYVRDFPQVQTFKDSGFTQATTTFKSTDVAYVQVRMFTTDAAVTATSPIFGNIIIKDYAGGTQLMRAPVNGHDTNVPICPVSGACSGTAISINSALRVYRFSINFTRANQDSWIDGTQNYALTLTSIKDADETYSNIATQLVIVAPLYKLDIVAGTGRRRWFAARRTETCGTTRTTAAGRPRAGAQRRSSSTSLERIRFRRSPWATSMATVRTTSPSVARTPDSLGTRTLTSSGSSRTPGLRTIGSPRAARRRSPPN